MRNGILMYTCTIIVLLPKKIAGEVIPEVCTAENILLLDEGISFSLVNKRRSIYRKILAVPFEQMVVITDCTEQISCCIPICERSLDSAYEIGEAFQTDEEEGYMIAEYISFFLGI